MYINNYYRKSSAVFMFFLAFLFFALARIIYIQFFSTNYLAGLAKKQYNLFLELEPRRGTIYDTNLKPLAVNVPVDSLYAAPKQLKDIDKEAIVCGISRILGINQQDLRDKLSRQKAFVWLARKLESEQSEAIKKLNLKGLHFIKESKRCYPNGYLASQIIGFAGMDNVGLEGLELVCDKYLKGEPGWALFLRDARQNKLDLSGKMVLPKDGYDLVLNIDEVIQYIAERELDKAFKASRAQGASIIVMNPHTGEILAMANRPTFDSNERAGINKDAMRNRAISDMFEPGSVFKIVTASAALEEKKVTEEDRFFCENGSYKFAGHILHDHQPHGWLTFRQVIEESSNIGTSKVAQILGPDLVYRYVRLFGFGRKSGIDLAGEIPGMTKEPARWSKLSIVIIPMGQEVGVTALQLVNAISVIANGGQLVKPFVVRQIRDKYGETIKSFIPAVPKAVISAETAARMTKILQGVIESGTGRLGKPDGFTAAGKTGTAQKLEANGTYSHDKFMASFIGFAPVEDPQIAVAVVVDQPRGSYYGGVVSAPVFKHVAQDVLRYLKSKKPALEPAQEGKNI